MDTTNDTANAPAKEQLQLTPGSSFTANGKVYIVSESFTIGRFEKVEEMEEELMMFADLKSCHGTMLAAMKKINDLNPGEAYMMLYNKIESDQRNAKMIKFTLRLCTAYINAEGEDTRYLTEETMKQKIDDWSAEGLDVRPFLSFAVSVYSILFESYKAHILDILKEGVTIKDGIEKLKDIRSSILTTASGSEKQ